MAKAAITIRIDRDVYAAIQALALAGKYEIPNRVLRRILGLPDDQSKR